MRSQMAVLAIFFVVIASLLNVSETALAEVTQDIGFPDLTYLDLVESDCRSCHGDFLYERHHVSTIGQSGDCLACHTEAGGFLQTETDCLVCHGQTGLNSPHHESSYAYDGLCAECHHANLVTDIVEVPPHDPLPYPGLHTCSENCHNSVPNADTHHWIADILCTLCHDPHGPSPFYGCEACHSPLTLHNIEPHRSACADCHGGEIPPPVPDEPVNPGIFTIDPNATRGLDTLLITGADFLSPDIDSRVDFDSTEAVVVFWGDSAIIGEIPDGAIGTYPVYVSNSLGVSNRAAFSLTADSPFNPIFAELDCATCHTGQHGFQAPDFTACASCHVIHGDIAAFHDMTRLPDVSCAECHDPNVEIEHTENRGIECAVCHDSTDPAIQDAIARGISGLEVFCGDCHADVGDHYCAHQVENNDCTSCHERNLQPEHNSDCAVCHESTDPVVIQAIMNGTPTCSACHDVAIHSMNCELCHTDKTWEEYQGQGQQVHQRHIDKMICGVCHMVPTEPVLEPTGQYCTICHDAEPYDPNDVTNVHRKHVKETGPVPFQCMTCHGRTIPDHLSTECELCHTDESYPGDWSDSRHQDHAQNFDCTACHQHPRDFNFPIADACSNCHDNHLSRGRFPIFQNAPKQLDGPPVMYNFQIHDRHMGRNQCWACHGGDDIAQQTQGFQCINCHESDPPQDETWSIHAKHAGDAYQCWVCHDALQPVYSLDQVNEPECP